VNWKCWTWDVTLWLRWSSLITESEIAAAQIEILQFPAMGLFRKNSGAGFSRAERTDREV
jgi:hypothetical protein